MDMTTPYGARQIKGTSLEFLKPADHLLPISISDYISMLWQRRAHFWDSVIQMLSSLLFLSRTDGANVFRCSRCYVKDLQITVCRVFKYISCL